MEWPLLILELAFQERRVSDYNLGGYNKLKIPHVNSRGSRTREARVRQSPILMKYRQPLFVWVSLD